MKVCEPNMGSIWTHSHIYQETLAVLTAVEKIFDEEGEVGRAGIGKEVKRVCKAEELAILQDLLPHITSLMDRAVKQEAAVRVVTHGDFHQWNMAFNGE